MKTSLRLVLLPLFLFVSPAALAIDWEGGDTADPTNWFVDNNWVGGTAPVKDNDVFIDTGAASPAVVDTLSTPALGALDDLTVGNTPTGVGSSLTIQNGGTVINKDNAYIGRESGSEGTVNVIGTGSKWNIQDDLFVGEFGTGVLNIEDGSAVSSLRGYIGHESGSEGMVKVTGGSTWTIGAQIQVGFEGNGTLNIENGSAVSSGRSTIGGQVGSEGKVNVTGGSTWTIDAKPWVGNDGKGELNIENGSTVSSDGGSIGNDLGSEGTVNVIGTGSKWNARGVLNVGNEGKGRLNILDGGLVETESAAIGSDSDLVEDFLVLAVGIATVKGENSKWVIGGTLAIGRYGNGTLNIENGGAVSNAKGYIGEESGSEGTVYVTGAGSTWDIVSDDDLYVGDYGTGTLTISDNGFVNVNNGNGTVYLAYEEGSKGTINMGAASGETALAPGELNAALVDFVAGTGTLVFNHTDETGTYVFAPDLSSNGVGTHSILHEAGYTNYNGDGSLFDGTTTVSGGTLAVNNVLAGDIEVNNGGTLGGSGTLGGNVNINEGGTVAPGNSIGTLTVNNITFGAGSIYNVELDGTPNADLLEVTGTAILEGGNVTVSGLPLFFGNRYTILTSTNNALTDEFAGVTDRFFIDYTLSYEDNNVYLTAAQAANTICNVAGTANQQSLACDGLDSLPLTDELLATIYNLLSAEEAREAYNALSGEFHPSLKSALMDNSQRRVDAVKNRLREGFAPDAPQTPTTALGYFAAPTAFDAPALPTDGDNGAWISGYGSWSTIDATTTTVQTENDLGGVVFGLDREAFDNMRFGILAGYSQTETTQTDRSSTGSAETMSVGVYGGAELGGATLSLGGIYNWHEIDTDRTVSYTGLSQDLTASYNAQSWQLFAEAGYKVQLHDKAMVEPFAAISHMSIDTDGYSETGGSAALTAEANTQSTNFATLGARAAIDVSNAVRATGMVGWRHAFGDIDPTSSFTLSGSSPFDVAGAPIAQTAFVSELGVEADLPIGGIISASYVGQMGGGTSAHGVDVSFKQRF